MEHKENESYIIWYKFEYVVYLSAWKTTPFFIKK